MNAEVKPFLWTALGWLAISVAVSAGAPRGAAWALGLWALCVLDLIALTKTLASALAIVSDSEEAKLPEKKAAHAIQAFFWGTIKIVCLGLFAVVLIRGQHSIPTTGLLLGLGTLVVVPLVGGMWWSQRVLRHA